MQKCKIKYFGYLFILCGILFFVPVFFTFYQKIEKEEKIQSFMNEKNKDNDYLGVLEIPKLYIKQGFYSFSSNFNKVDQNVQLIEGSVMPGDKNSNLILAAHSGNSYKSYFKNLYKLKINDKAFIYYKQKIYVYKYVNKYQEIKDGAITVHEEEQSRLMLVTCNKQNNNLQDIYVFYLIESLDMM